MNNLEVTAMSLDSRQARELLSEQNLRSKLPINYSVTESVGIGSEKEKKKRKEMYRALIKHW